MIKNSQPIREAKDGFRGYVLIFGICSFRNICRSMGCLESPVARLPRVESLAMNHKPQGLAPLAGGCENRLDVTHEAVQPVAVRNHTSGGPLELSERQGILVHTYSPTFSRRVIKCLVFPPTPRQIFTCLLNLLIMQKAQSS